MAFVDASLALNLALTLISLGAVLLALRQNRLSNGGNHLPVILEAFKEAHAPDSDYLDAEKYILNNLAREHLVDCGITELPREPARRYVLSIGMFFDDLGKVVAHGMIHQDVVVGSFGPGIIPLWRALAPYVYEQRRTGSPNFWIYFEDLAVRATIRPNTDVYKKLGLRSWPPGRDTP